MLTDGWGGIMKKLLKRITLRLGVLLVVGYFCWPITALFVMTGLYDVLRQRNVKKLMLLKQYFLVNGTLTWLFSPLNTLIDLFCLPFINQQIYRLDMLPKTHQKEIQDIIDHCPKKELIDVISRKDGDNERSMLLYRWYGFNINNQHSCPLFHKKFKRILTIGVSTFKAQSQTKPHFGWLRAGVRVLINIDDDVGPGAFIDVNNQRHTWQTDGPLFIFDDTVLHQSYNLTDASRHCLFIDITRPSMLPLMINGIIKGLGYLSVKLTFLSRSSNWKIEL